MDEVFARANPNPERKGCPSDQLLQELATKQRPISDPAYEHLAQCSPCYRTFRQFQRELRSNSVRRESGYRRWFAVAAVLLLVLASVWFVASRHGGSVDVDGREVRAEMDLRKYAVDRSDTGARAQQPLRGQRVRLELTILLPVGSEAGSYDLQVMDSALRSRFSASGEARIEHYITTLHTRMDLRGLPSGHYKLALRRSGEDWRFFPLYLE